MNKSPEKQSTSKRATICLKLREYNLKLANRSRPPISRKLSSRNVTSLSLESESAKKRSQNLKRSSRRMNSRSGRLRKKMRGPRRS